jgi:hypothetical protein
MPQHSHDIEYNAIKNLANLNLSPRQWQGACTCTYGTKSCYPGIEKNPKSSLGCGPFHQGVLYWEFSECPCVGSGQNCYTLNPIKNSCSQGTCACKCACDERLDNYSFSWYQLSSGKTDTTTYKDNLGSYENDLKRANTVNIELMAISNLNLKSICLFVGSILTLDSLFSSSRPPPIYYDSSGILHNIIPVDNNKCLIKCDGQTKILSSSRLAQILGNLTGSPFDQVMVPDLRGKHLVGITNQTTPSTGFHYGDINVNDTNNIEYLQLTPLKVKNHRHEITNYDNQLSTPYKVCQGPQEFTNIPVNLSPVSYATGSVGSDESYRAVFDANPPVYFIDYYIVADYLPSSIKNNTRNK